MTTTINPPLFAIRDLSVLAYAQGFTLWLYRHPGSYGQTKVPNFFQAACDMFKPGDIVIVQARDGTGQRVVQSTEPHLTTTQGMAP